MSTTANNGSNLITQFVEESYLLPLLKTVESPDVDYGRARGRKYKEKYIYEHTTCVSHKFIRLITFYLAKLGLIRCTLLL
jgi:hypothetical protein